MSEQPDPGSAHDPSSDSARWETLSLLALGERVDTDLEFHISECGECQGELRSLRRTVELGRSTGDVDGPAPMPSERVWAGIVSELGMTGTPTLDQVADEPLPVADHTRAARPSQPARPSHTARPSRRQAFALAAGVALIAGTGVTGGYLIGRTSGGASTTVSASADLTPFPGGPAGVSGRAKVHDNGTGTRVSIDTAQLPVRNGYYEVWLYDPQDDKMVAIGTLPRSGAADLPVPPGLNVNSYHIVDVSAQDYNGNPAHQQSVLRGGLRW
ncbi:MAG: anti-sigma factor [Allobranchiibius sp.]